MNYDLAKILQTSSQFTAVLSQIMKVHMPIVDNYQLATPQMHAQIDFDMSEVSGIVEEAFRTGELQIMKEAKGHPACARCPQFENCQECFEIWAPITVYNEVIGVVGFVCSQEQQRQVFVQSSDAYVTFLQQIAALIALEAVETHEHATKSATIALLETILEQVETGVLVLDASDRLLRINKRGRALLHQFIATAEYEPVKISETGKLFLGLPEYEMQIQGQALHLVGKMFAISIEPYAKVFLFNDAKALQENPLSMNVGRISAINQITGVSEALNGIKHRIRLIAPSSSHVLITGELGLGKELYARAIHDESDRADQPFLVVTCTAMPEQALEEELFGCQRDDKTRTQAGKLEGAWGGTLFLNGVHALPPRLQEKLMQTLDRRAFSRNDALVAINVRIVCATSENLELLCKQGRFLEELYYLIGVIPLHLPPLRERRDDIRPLASNFIHEFSGQLNKNVTGIDEAFWSVLEQYSWPGNVRELQNAMEYMINMLTYPGVITSALLPRKLAAQPANALPEDINLEHMERELIRRALLIYGGGTQNYAELARRLGIGMATLYRKIKKFQL